MSRILKESAKSASVMLDGCQEQSASANKGTEKKPPHTEEGSSDFEKYVLYLFILLQKVC